MSDQEQKSKSAKSVRRWGRRVLGCFTFFLILVFAYYGFYFILRGPIPPTAQLIAHRGGNINSPENTLMAFQHAIELGVDWIEFDVQRTQDNVLVVFHDEMIERTTNGSGSVGEKTIEQIQALDAGNGEQVPTFEQVIALAKKNNVGIMPEAKSPDLYPGLAEQMLAAIESQDYINETVLQSFDLIH